MAGGQLNSNVGAGKSMNEENYNRFKELRQQYYLAGRSLLINRFFGMAGINFGYSIELSLKFILLKNGYKKSKLLKHGLRDYYRMSIDDGFIPKLSVSDDFLQFIDERLNTRYPIMIEGNFKAHLEDNRAYVFTIDMLHCYDDLILQLDDAITEGVSDPRISIGFRSCRDLSSTSGRIFFHSNDHAFARIEKYIAMLQNNRDDNDNFELIKEILVSPNELWNFTGLIAFRPWGPKSNWNPALDFQFPKVENKHFKLKAATWQGNHVGTGLYLSSADIMLPKGKYKYEISQVEINAQQRK